jgi:hypothetical protein
MRALVDAGRVPAVQPANVQRRTGTLETCRTLPEFADADADYVLRRELGREAFAERLRGQMLRSENAPPRSGFLPRLQWIASIFR